MDTDSSPLPNSTEINSSAQEMLLQCLKTERQADLLSQNGLPECLLQCLQESHQIESVFTGVKKQLQTIPQLLEPFSTLHIDPFSSDITQLSKEVKVKVIPRDQDWFLLHFPEIGGYHNTLTGQTKVAQPSSDYRTNIKELLAGHSSGNIDSTPRQILMKMVTEGNFGDVVTTTAQEVIHNWQRPDRFISSIRLLPSQTQRTSVAEVQAWKGSGDFQHLVYLLANASPPSEIPAPYSSSPEVSALYLLSQSYNRSPEEFMAADGIVDRLNGLARALKTKTGQAVDIKYLARIVGSHRYHFEAASQSFPELDRVIDRLATENSLTPQDMAAAAVMFKLEQRLTSAQIRLITLTSLTKAAELVVDQSLSEVLKNYPVKLSSSSSSVTPTGIDFEITAPEYYPGLISLARQTSVLENEDSQFAQDLMTSDRARIVVAQKVLDALWQFHPGSTFAGLKLVHSSLLGIEKIKAPQYPQHLVETKSLNFGGQTFSQRFSNLVKYSRGFEELIIGIDVGCHSDATQREAENMLAQKFTKFEEKNTSTTLSTEAVPDAAIPILTNISFENTLDEVLYSRQIIAVRSIIEQLASASPKNT